MDKIYKFKCEILDEDDKVISSGSVSFVYENVGTFGDCSAVDEEVGRTLRRLVGNVEAKESLHELEAELLLTNGQQI